MVDKDLTHRVAASARSRLIRDFWIAAFLIGIVSFFGTRELFRSIVDVDVKQAQRAALLAEGSAKLATEATDEARRQTRDYIRTVEELKANARSVDLLFGALRERLQAEADNVKASVGRDISDLNTRISKLEGLVAKIAEESQASQRALATYRAEVERLKASSRADQERFAANNFYTVNVYADVTTRILAERVRQKLSEAGFKASTADIVQYERVQSFSKVFIRTAPAVNTIFYGSGARAKAIEIRELLLPIVKIKGLVEREPFTFRQFVELFGDLTTSNLIFVVLVEP